MNERELDAQVARLLGWKIEYVKQGYQITRPDGREFPVYASDVVTLDKLREEIPFSTDVNAAMQACLTLGWLPEIGECNGAINVQIRHMIETATVRGDYFVEISDQSPQEMTQAIARALCEALVEAEGVGDGE